MERPPPVNQNLVSRHHLLSLLTQYSNYPLTLITAPAGFGKTTLVKSWLSSDMRGSEVVWLALNEADNQAMQLLRRIGKALASLTDNTEESLALFDSNSPADRQVLLAALLRLTSNLTQRFIVVIDDFHFITAADVHRAMTTFIERMSPELHIVLISRSVPPMPLARFRANGWLLEIGSNLLRFTQAEIQTFLSTVGIQLDQHDLLRLEQRTEGWIAGLQLLALAAQNCSEDDRLALIRRLSGENRYIFDYLVEEIVNQQNDETHAFLMQTAILEQMNSSLCNAVTLRLDGQQRLEQLAHSNAFTSPVDETTQWYRYHPLFRETLLAHLQRTMPELTSELHQRAALWYSQQGDITKAVNHFFTASDFRSLAELLERNGDRMWTHQEMVNLCQWTEHLPESILVHYPRLTLLRAWALLMVGQVSMSESQLQQVWVLLEQRTSNDSDLIGIHHIIRAAALLKRDPEQSLAWYQQAAQTLPETTYNWQGALALGRGFAYMETGDLLRAEHSFAAAVAPSRMCGNLYAAMYAIYNLGRAQMVHGALQRAQATFEYALELAHREPEPMQQLVSWAYLGLSEVAYERNNLTNATQHVLNAITIGKRRENRETVARSYLVLARIQAALGQADEAFKILHTAEHIAGEASLTEVVTGIRLWQCRLYLTQGRQDEAQRIHALLRLSSPQYSTLQSAAIERFHVRLMIVNGQTSEAQQLLQQQTNHSHLAAIESRVLMALIAHANDRLHEALRHLNQAFEQSRSEQFCRIFLDEGEPIKLLLSAAVHHQIGTITASKLLAEFDHMGSFNPVEIEQATIEPLSRVELEILHFISQGFSNQQIADDRFISLNTVKWHLKNLYGKLGVKSRMAAAARARKLNLC